MPGPSDTTKTLCIADDVALVLKRNKLTGHFTATAGASGIVADIPKDHYVEVRMKWNRLEITKRPFPIPPTYEQVRDALVAAEQHETVDEQIVSIMKLFGIQDPKPTRGPVDEYTGE